MHILFYKNRCQILLKFQPSNQPWNRITGDLFKALSIFFHWMKHYIISLKFSIIETIYHMIQYTCTYNSTWVQVYPSLIFAAAWPFLSPLFLQLSFTAFWDCGILTYFECYEFSFLDSLIQCVQNLWRIRVRNVPFPYNEILFVLNEIQMLAWWIIRVGRLFVLLSSFSKKNVFCRCLKRIYIVTGEM